MLESKLWVSVFMVKGSIQHIIQGKMRNTGLSDTSSKWKLVNRFSAAFFVVTTTVSFFLTLTYAVDFLVFAFELSSHVSLYIVLDNHGTRLNQNDGELLFHYIWICLDDLSCEHVIFVFKGNKKTLLKLIFINKHFLSLF